MRDCYKYNSIKSWKEYYAEKAKGFPYSGSAAFKLNDGCYERSQNNKLNEPCASFLPYWLALELIHEGKANEMKITIEELLAKCKKNYKAEVSRQKSFESRPDCYKGHPLIWDYYQPYKEEFCSWDRVTLRCIIPEKLTDEECKEIREGLWEHWYNPYNDGRDCTGVWFTSSISFYRCEGKTIIHHTKHCDV